MSSFSHRSIASRLEKKNQTSRVVQFFVLFIGFLMFISWYLIWSVGQVSVAKGKYDIKDWYTLSVLSEKLWLDVASWRYRLWVRFFAPSVSVDAGTYEVYKSTLMREFVSQTLKSPTYNDQSITILPGWSSYDIDTYLVREGVGEVGDFLESSRLNFSKYQSEYKWLTGVNSLEWYYYPDTYRIRRGATMDEVIRVMLRQFDKKIGAEYLSLDSKKAYQTLILASIVEREERSLSNQPIVAGILSKRVKEWIAMGADATVCYGYAKTQKQCTPAFIGTIIQDTNPYNTRNKQGYPPTPISNISLSTWQAALHPEDSPYYYYLHDTSGQIHYGRTLEEHNTHKRNYLQ